MTLDDIPKLSKDELLVLLGLQKKPSTEARLSETLGIFGLGLLVGAGIALILAPKRGRELRNDIRDRWRRQADGRSASPEGPPPDAPKEA
ncbi:MAG TPA: YtxH domain-containing protein [Polyangia bacterium]|nr:YtxH domain-containing protein [Polyangia bacterium]